MHQLNKLLLAALCVFTLCPPGVKALQQGKLPAGAELSVAIDGVDTSLGSVAVNVVGSVSIGAPVDPATTQIIYAVDLSGSTLQSVPCGDHTAYSDALPDTLHQCIVAALQSVNETADSLGINEVGLVFYAGSALAADVSPDPGFQGLTGPGTTSDLISLTPDVEKVLRSTAVDPANGTVGEFTPGNVGHGTNFGAAIDEAIFLSRSGPADNQLVIFISDGFASVGRSVAETLTARMADGTVPIFNTVALGSDCSAAPNGLGSLQALAEATGGNCTNIPDFNTLNTLVFDSGPPTLTALAVQIDGGAPIPFETGDIQPLPLTGPQTAIFRKTLLNLPIGRHELCVIATGRDPGGSNSIRDCRQIGIGFPRVFLFTPQDGQVFSNPTIVFTGAANDLEDGELTSSLLWTSDIDGALGSGGEVTATLSPGTHLITASVTDSDGLSDTKQVTVAVNGGVNTPPTVQISAPADASNFIEGEPITLSAIADDAEDGDLTAQIQWTSSLNGGLGTGGTLAAVILSTGTHQISAAVGDSAGETATDSIEITVAANQAPTVSILSPMDGATFDPDQPVDLQGVASDAEDGDLSANIEWDSDLDGPLGNGDTLTVMLSTGTHHVTAAVVDSRGAGAETTVVIAIRNTLPPDCRDEDDENDDDEDDEDKDDDHHKHEERHKTGKFDKRDRDEDEDEDEDDDKENGDDDDCETDDGEDR